jgi:formate hydrogenlyase subunit 6/NADH:ubiquinone oxidoreductase subunit I
MSYNFFESIKKIFEINIFLYLNALKYKFNKLENIKNDKDFKPVGKIKILRDNSEKLLCDACGICKSVCPCKDTITIEKEFDENGNIHVRYERNEEKCIYCGLCVENCPKKALEHSSDENIVTLKKSDLRKIV